MDTDEARATPLAATAVLGGILWIVAELIEGLGAGLTPLTLWLTAVAFLLLAVGVMALHRVQAAVAGPLSFGGAILMAVGFLGFLLPLFAILAGRLTATGAQPGTLELMFLAALVALVLGGVMLGLAIMRAGILPARLGAALTIVSLAMIVAALADTPVLAARLTNLALAATLAALGAAALRR